MTDETSSKRVGLTVLRIPLLILLALVAMLVIGSLVLM